MTSSGVDSPPSSPPGAKSLVGRILSERYRIQSVLGEGGMGAVYLAEHVLMRKRLAVKVLHPEMTRMPEMVARFEREAMAAAHIEHPNVAAATDFGKLEDGAFFLVLEYVEGTSLRDLIAQGPLTAERALHICYQIASALARAHALGIVHRDLKPENVMLVERDTDPNFVKVLDFGIAKVPVGELSQQGPNSGQVLTQLGMVYGTPEYMAPEQALGQEVDARADLYALGVMLFEMLTGVRPFESDSKVSLLGMKVTSDPPSIASKNPSVRVPEAVEAIVRHLLDKEAKSRFQDAREILDAIDKTRIGEAMTEVPSGRMNLNAATGPASARYRASLASVSRAALGSGDVSPSGARLAERRAQMLAWVNGVREKLPAVLSQFPAWALVVSGGLVVLLLVLVSLVVFRGPESVAAPTASDGTPASPAPPIFKKWLGPSTAPGDALATASASGAAALEELSGRYPDDPAVVRALVHAYTKEKRYPDAMHAISKLVSLNERAVDDDEIKESIIAAAGNLASVDAAFDLLENGLGSKGPDLLYDLSTTKGLSPRTMTRIKQALGKKWRRARAPGASQAPERAGLRFSRAQRMLGLPAPRQRARHDDRGHRGAHEKVAVARSNVPAAWSASLKNLPASGTRTS